MLCPAGEAVLERHVSDEQAAADLEAIRSMWELAAVYEFMGQFKFWLNFSQLYPLQDLEEALVRSPGPGEPGRLAGHAVSQHSSRTVVLHTNTDIRTSRESQGLMKPRPYLLLCCLIACTTCCLVTCTTCTCSY
jgi:hypothetical protein